MKGKRILFVTCSIVLSVFVALAAGQTIKPKERNLKVLPKDISNQMLDSIMGSYNIALGVGCDFCHNKAKPLFPTPNSQNQLDYSLDGNPMKEEARRMMRLTIELNKNHFYYDSTKRPEYLTVIKCKTCHQGHIFPPEE